MTVLYTSEHEWINTGAGDTATVGITTHAQDALGDVVFVDLPKVGATFKKGAVAGVVESVKAAADLYAPVSGEVVEVNKEVAANVMILGDDPYDKGWLIKVRPDGSAPAAELLDAASYEKQIADDAH